MNVHPMRRMQDLRSSNRMRKGMFILPSLFTSANIAAGYYAITQTVQGISGDSSHFDNAAIAIGFAVLFDGLDGRIARMTNTTSEFGKQLDSLADVIAFGVGPAVLAYMWGFRFIAAPADNLDWQHKLVQLGAVVTFLFMVAGASRLARFNIQNDPRPKNPGRPGRKYFVGMPIPAGAGVIASVVHLAQGKPLQLWWLSMVWMVLVFGTGYFMVSTWRFYSPKQLDFRRQQPFSMVLLVAGAIALIWFFSGPVLFLLAMTYMFAGIIARLSYSLRHGEARTT